MLPMKNARMFLLILTATLYTASAQTAFTVNGKANIYAAGQSVAPDGELPYEIDFNPQEAQAVEFSSVTGTSQIALRTADRTVPCGMETRTLWES